MTLVCDIHVSVNTMKYKIYYWYLCDEYFSLLLTNSVPVMRSCFERSASPQARNKRVTWNRSLLIISSEQTHTNFSPFISFDTWPSLLSQLEFLFMMSLSRDNRKGITSIYIHRTDSSQVVFTRAITIDFTPTLDTWSVARERKSL